MEVLPIYIRARVKNKTGFLEKPGFHFLSKSCTVFWSISKTQVSWRPFFEFWKYCKNGRFFFPGILGRSRRAPIKTGNPLFPTLGQRPLKWWKWPFFLFSWKKGNYSSFIAYQGIHEKAVRRNIPSPSPSPHLRSPKLGRFWGCSKKPRFWPFLAIFGDFGGFGVIFWCLPFFGSLRKTLEITYFTLFYLVITYLMIT